MYTLYLLFAVLSYQRALMQILCAKAIYLLKIAQADRKIGLFEIFHCIYNRQYLSDKHGYLYERLINRVAPNGWIAKYSICLKMNKKKTLHLLLTVNL